MGLNIHMAVKEKISIREYARRIGTSETAIRKAINAGKITKGFDKATKKIIPHHADIEYGRLKNEKVEVPSSEGNGSDKLKLEKNSPYAEIRKAKELLQVNLLNLELQEKQGKFVSKEKVISVLMAFGQEIRKAFEHIPERTVDNIRSAETRNAALRVLADEIQITLQRLSEIEHLTFDQRK